MRLTPSKKAARTYSFASFDIESRNWIEFLILGFYDGQEYREFYSIPEFLDHVIRRKYSGYRIFAHNGGKYDFLFLIEYLKQPYKLLDVNGRIFAIIVDLGNRHKLTFIDSYYTLQFSLEKLIKTIIPDSPYQKIDIDFENIRLDETTRLHLKNDVYALYEIMDTFQDMINSLGGELKPTIAATAMDLFKRKYLEFEIPYRINDLERFRIMDQHLRSAYFGGRTEVYKKLFEGKENELKYYDFNSLYPSVMCNSSFPVGYPYYIEDYNFSPIDTGFAYIETEYNFNIPLLPFRVDSMLLFPNGRINGLYSIPFLERLQSLDIPFKTRYAYLFDKEKIFKNYVNDLYRLRMDHSSNEVLKYTVKLLLNSLYGKFGQHPVRKKFIVNPQDSYIRNNIGKLEIYSAKYDIFTIETEHYSNFMLPHIAAYVTTYAQLKLFDYLNESTYYCDTDSIITTENLKVSDELGELKLEDEIKEAIFLTQKVYVYRTSDGKIKKRAKGFPYSQLEHITFKDFKTSLLNNDYSIFAREWKDVLGWKESLIRTKNILSLEKKRKSIRTIDTKRYFKSFNESIPFTI